jgi:hypothetical protein
MPLQIRRGTEAERQSMTQPLAPGELLYTTNTVTGEKQLFVGDGATLGGNLVGGFSISDAKDAAAASILAGTHENITFTYNSTTKSLSARVDIIDHNQLVAESVATDQIFDRSSTLIVDLINATFNGDVNGNLVGDSLGYHTGDVKGSVFASDSTMLVDATNGSIRGDIITSLIRSEDSSRILVDTPIAFSTDVVVEGESIFENEAIFRIANSTSRILTISQHHDDQLASALTFRRGRNTEGIPTALVADDVIGDIDWNGFNGTGYITGASIKGVYESGSGDFSRARLEFYTVDPLSNLSTRRLTIDTVGSITAEAQIRQVIQRYSATAPLQISLQHHDTAASRNIVYARSRGTADSSQIVQNGDEIINLRFNGFDGTNYLSGAGISAVVQGATSTGTMPSRLDFSTNNGTSLATRVTINPGGRLDALNGLRVTGTIQPGLTNGNVILDPAIQGSGEVRTTGSLRVNGRVLISDNRISTLVTNDDIELDPNGTGTIDFQIAEQLTVGSAGAASALPATPSTYFKIKVNGVEYVVPAYAVS